jgi:hypothetical protein
MHSFESIVTQVKLGGAVTSQLTVHMLQQTPLERLYAEGFRNWDGTMVLLPLWALTHMAPGEHLVCIDGEIAQVGRDEIDDDTRGGCIAYGIQRDDIPAKGNK